jgi:hypothetical protein
VSDVVDDLNEEIAWAEAHPSPITEDAQPVDLMIRARDELIAQRERCAWLGMQVEELVRAERGLTPGVEQYGRQR